MFTANAVGIDGYPGLKVFSNGKLNKRASAHISRIRDADFAAETANLSKNQVLQQAGISVLAQANALPQQALSLLG